VGTAVEEREGRGGDARGGIRGGERVGVLLFAGVGRVKSVGRWCGECIWWDGEVGRRGLYVLSL